jgi:hypothetical protein
LPPTAGPQLNNKERWCLDLHHQHFMAAHLILNSWETDVPG